MMHYLSYNEVIVLHAQLIDRFGGSHGVRDRGAIESALAQPSASFGGEDLYPSLLDKAAALCFSLVQNHPFVDGNKRIGYAVMRIFLELNGTTILASQDEKEEVILRLASGTLKRGELCDWLEEHTAATSSE